MARLAQAALFSAIPALIGGFASAAFGAHHFWPGVIESFVVFVPVWMMIEL